MTDPIPTAPGWYVYRDTTIVPEYPHHLLEAGPFETSAQAYDEVSRLQRTTGHYDQVHGYLDKYFVRREPQDSFENYVRKLASNFGSLGAGK